MDHHPLKKRRSTTNIGNKPAKKERQEPDLEKLPSDIRNAKGHERVPREPRAWIVETASSRLSGEVKNHCPDGIHQHDNEKSSYLHIPDFHSGLLETFRWRAKHVLQYRRANGDIMGVYLHREGTIKRKTFSR